jgi:hypothetical protein
MRDVCKCDCSTYMRDVCKCDCSTYMRDVCKCDCSTYMRDVCRCDCSTYMRDVCKCDCSTYMRDVCRCDCSTYMRDVCRCDCSTYIPAPVCTSYLPYWMIENRLHWVNTVNRMCVSATSYRSVGCRQHICSHLIRICSTQAVNQPVFIVSKCWTGGCWWVAVYLLLASVPIHPCRGGDLFKWLLSQNCTISDYFKAC